MNGDPSMKLSPLTSHDAETAGNIAHLFPEPDRDEPGTGESLTGVGVFLFVSLPLFAAGLLVYGSG